MVKSSQVMSTPRSKKQKNVQNTNSGLSQPGYGDAYLIGISTPNNLVGRILTIVDALGLKDTQEKSLKNILEQEIWKTFDTQGWDCMYIPDELHSSIRKFSHDYKEEMQKSEYVFPSSGFPYAKKFKIETED